MQEDYLWLKLIGIAEQRARSWKKTVYDPFEEKLKKLSRQLEADGYYTDVSMGKIVIPGLYFAKKPDRWWKLKPNERILKQCYVPDQRFAVGRENLEDINNIIPEEIHYSYVRLYLDLPIFWEFNVQVEPIIVHDHYKDEFLLRMPELVYESDYKTHQDLQLVSGFNLKESSIIYKEKMPVN